MPSEQELRKFQTFAMMIESATIVKIFAQATPALTEKYNLKALGDKHKQSAFDFVTGKISVEDTKAQHREINDVIGAVSKEIQFLAQTPDKG